jgi:diacylglycerol kinase
MMGAMVRHLRGAAFRMALRLLADGTSAAGLTAKNGSFVRALKNALRGLLFTFVNERNFRFECAAAVAAAACGVLFGISRIEWTVLVLNIFLVLALEAKNTATELTTNLATRDYDYDAKGSKDASSGAVLLAVLAAIINGLCIFGPPLWRFAVNTVSYLLN